MNDTSRRVSARRSAESDGPGLWIVFAIGLLLMAAASLLRADEAGNLLRRTERFTASLPARSTLRVLNVSGDVIATPGRDFSAVCQTTVTASTKARVEEILARTKTVQVRDGDELRLESRWPDMGDGDWSRRSSRNGQWRNARCRDCRITMQYEIVVPPGVIAVLHTVNGEVRIQDVDGELDAQTVNGNVIVRGSRRGVRAQTVNGKIEVTAAAAPQGAAIDLRTVSGAVLLTLPKDARFDLSASAMNGSIVSTFPFAPQAAAAAAAASAETSGGSEAERAERAERRARAEHSRARHRVVVERRGDDTVVDVPELERELEESMRDMDVQVRESLRDAERETSRMKFLMPGGEYKGSIGPAGGAHVHVSTLSGRIAILAANTQESEAKPLVARRSFVVTIPRIDTRIHEKIAVPRPPRPPRTDSRAHHDVEEPEDEAVVRGDVAGDFLATAGAGTYRVGKVSGKVNILTHSGEIHIGGAGASADLKSYGGDIQIGPVQGDLKAQTLAGDIRAGAVAGSVSADTSGGDVRIDRVAGSADVKTGGGDVVLPSVAGGVHVETGGGEVRVGLVSREARGGVTIRNAGGDVTLTLPANFRGEIELTASDADLDETAIRSDFPEISVTRRSGSQQATATLNGGGPKVTVRTSSGSIRVRKGPSV